MYFVSALKNDQIDENKFNKEFVNQIANTLLDTINIISSLSIKRILRPNRPFSTVQKQLMCMYLCVWLVQKVNSLAYSLHGDISDEVVTATQLRTAQVRTWAWWKSICWIGNYKINRYIELLLYARFSSKCFTGINPFDPPHKPWREEYISSLL